MKCFACLTFHGDRDPCPAVDRVNVVPGKPHITRWHKKWSCFGNTRMPSDWLNAGWKHAQRLNGATTV
jgi:hypothetical protein